MLSPSVYACVENPCVDQIEQYADNGSTSWSLWTWYTFSITIKRSTFSKTLAYGWYVFIFECPLSTRCRMLYILCDHLLSSFLHNANMFVIVFMYLSIGIDVCVYWQTLVNIFSIVPGAMLNATCYLLDLLCEPEPQCKWVVCYTGAGALCNMCKSLWLCLAK